MYHFDCELLGSPEADGWCLLGEPHRPNGDVRERMKDISKLPQALDGGVLSVVRGCVQLSAGPNDRSRPHCSGWVQKVAWDLSVPLSLSFE